ncbi:MAG: thioredoxin domain-containing protein [Acidimicrobiales bacterium]
MLGIVERIVLAVVLAMVALGVAAVLRRRQRPSAPIRTGYALPAQVDRGDFERPDAPWLVAVFTSATCRSCAGVWERAQPLASHTVAVQQVEHIRDKALHERYAIEAVPATLVIDGDGVVVASFVGPVTATDLWAAVAEAREPGTTPPQCHPR